MTDPPAPPAPKSSGATRAGVTRWRLEVPEGVAPESYFAGLLACVAFGVAAGSALMLVGILFLRTSGPLAHPGLYTVSGLTYFHPEHETAFFLAGAGTSVAVVLISARLWNRRLLGQCWGSAELPAGTWGTMAGLAVVFFGAGLSLFLAGGRLVFYGAHVPATFLVAMLAIPLACGVAAAFAGAARFRWVPIVDGLDAPPPKRRLSVLDVAVPVFIAAVVFVPAWRVLSGHFYLSEQLYDWDYFAMGPALAFAHGAALGTSVHIQYGFGWPVFFALISPLLKLSYGHMLAFMTVYACVYFCGLYLLLRVVTRSAVWAVAGMLVGLLAQLFSGTYTTLNIWDVPQLTDARRPMDVWFFLVVWLHLRTRRPVWAVLAGALAGAALVFETDTGLYLLAALGVYWVCIAAAPEAQSGGQPRAIPEADPGAGGADPGAGGADPERGSGAWRGWFGARRERLRVIGASMAAVVVVVVAGFGVASRWTMFSPVFWSSLLQPIAEASQGYTALPMVGRFSVWGTNLPDGRTLALFVVVAGLYVAVIAALAIKLMHRRATALEAFLGCVSVYGFLELISFTGRSHPFNLPHTLVPFVLVVTVLAANAQRSGWPLLRRMGGRAGRLARAGWGAMPIAALLVVAITLAFNPVFRAYPGLLETGGKIPGGTGLCLLAGHEVCGIPAADRSGIAEFDQVTAEMRHLSASGTVALIDYQNVYNLASGVAPWGPDAPLLTSLFTKAQALQVQQQLVATRPTYVMIRTRSQVAPIILDVWQGLHAVVASHYTYLQTVGQFEVWRLHAPSG